MHPNQGAMTIQMVRNNYILLERLLKLSQNVSCYFFSVPVSGISGTDGLFKHRGAESLKQEPQDGAIPKT